MRWETPPYLDETTSVGARENIVIYVRRRLASGRKETKKGNDSENRLKCAYTTINTFPLIRRY